MIHVSEQASAALNSDCRKFRARFLLNGEVISGNIKNITVNKGSCGDSEFVPGALFSSFIDATIDYCPVALEKKELLLQFGVQIGEGYEWTDIGWYTVSEPATNVYTTSFTGLGRLSARAGGVYETRLAFPTTIQAVLDEISSQIGIAIDASAFDTSGMIETKPSGYTHREMLAFIAGIFFGYATETSAGNIKFFRFTTDNSVETNGDRTTQLPAFADTDTEVTGVRVTATQTQEDESAAEKTFVYGIVNVALSNPFMTQALFDANVSNIIGFKYRTGTVPISMGDYRLEDSDCLKVTDIVGNTYLVPCMHVQHVFDGGISTYVTAPAFTAEDDSSSFKGPLIMRIARYETDLIMTKRLIADKVSAEEVEAIVAKFGYMTADEADIKYATITELTSISGRIDILASIAITTNNLKAKVADLGYLSADNADLKYASVGSLETAEGRITTLETSTLKTSELSAEVAKLGYATVENLEAAKARIKTLETDTIKADKLESEVAAFGYLKTATANAIFATITDLNSANATIKDLQAKAITTDNLSAKVAALGYLKADTLEAEVAELGYLRADTAALTYATITGLNAVNAQISALKSDVASIDTLIFGSASGTTIQTEFSNAVIAQLGNAQIKSAMIESISAGKISSGDIITNNIRVMSEDGKLIISDETIQISDSTRVRVQIGKDSSADYSINIWDANGKLMFSEGGITDSAIKNAIIRNDMVSESANISASKLNIDSLFAEINGSTNTIKSTKIYLDDKAQTLDIVLAKMSSDAEGLSKNITSQGTAISVIQGQISSKIWQQDITSEVGPLEEQTETLSTKYASLLQTVNGLSTTVAGHTTEIGEKADSSTVTKVTDRVASLELGLDSFQTTVSDTYATKGALATTDTKATNAQKAIESLATRVVSAETTIAQNSAQIALKATKEEVTATLDGYYTKTQTDAAITTKANQITSTVEATYQKGVSRGEQLVTNGNGLLGNNTNFSQWTFDGAIANNSPGSFTKAQGVKSTLITDEFFPVSTSNEYTFAFDIKSKYGLARQYSMLLFYDADKNQIAAGNHIYNAGSTTTLAKDLKAGDTTIYLTSAAGWSTTYSYGFYVIVWNYKNKFGYTYPAETYSRTRITLPKTSNNLLNSSCLNKNANTITLATAYSGATIPAGTAVSQGGDGATYKYFPLSNVLVPTQWTRYSGTISGVDYSGGNKPAMFPPGTAYAKVGFLWNYNTAADQLWVTNIVVTDTTAVNAAKKVADKAQTDVNSLATRVTQTESGITSQASQISSLGTRMSTVEQTADGLAVSLGNVESEVDSISSAKYLISSYSLPLATLKGWATEGKDAGTWVVTSTTGVRVGDTVYIRCTNSDTGQYLYIVVAVTRVASSTSLFGISHGFIDPYATDVANTAKTNAATAQSTANSAASAASAAQTTADTANSTANTANSTANSVQSNLANNYTPKTFPDTRSANQNPQWYITNYPKQSITEFKYCSTIGLSGVSETYCSLTTEVPWNDSSGGWPKQTAKAGGKEYWRVGASATAWGAWQDALGTAINAAKTATNFMSYDATNGLLIGNKSGGSWAGYRAQVKADSFNILDTNGAVLSSFGANKIELGNNSANTVIEMCGALGTIEADNYGTYSGLAVKGEWVHVSGSSGAALSAAKGDTKNLILADQIQVYATSNAKFNESSGEYVGDAYWTLASGVAFMHGDTRVVLEGGESIELRAGTDIYLNASKINLQGNLSGKYVTGTWLQTTAITDLGSKPSKIAVLDGNGWVYYRSPAEILSDIGAAATHSHPYLSTSGGTLGGSLTVTGTLNMKGPIEMSRSTPYIDFHYGSSTADYTSRIWESASGTLKLLGTAMAGLEIPTEIVGLFASTNASLYSGHLRPTSDAKCTLGTAANRFYGIYAAQASIQTSDGREKENIIPLNDIHSQLFDLLKPVEFNFTNGNHRKCYGLIAQEVVEAMELLGISEDELDLIHHDKWIDENTNKLKDSYGLAYNNLLALLIREVQTLKRQIAAMTA